MSTAPTATRPGTALLLSGIDPNITCNYCKKPGHTKEDYQKGISTVSNLWQNEPTGRTVLERRRSPPQAQEPQIGRRKTRRCVTQPK